jgi:ABC-2 type transport system permease protein
MRVIVTLVRKDIANLMRNRTAMSLTFLVPIMLIYIFGQVFGLNRKDTGPVGIRLAVVNASDRPAAQKLVDALKAEKAFRIVTHRKNPDQTERLLTEADLRPMIRDREFRFAVVIPQDVVSETRLGLHLKILSDPRNEIETQTVNGVLQKTIFSSVPELLGQSLQDRAKKILGEPRLKQFNGSIASAIATAFGGNKEEIQRRLESGNFSFSRTSPVAKPADPALRQLDPPSSTTAASAAPKDQEKAAPSFLSQIVKIDREQVVGKDVQSPDATRVVGGWAIMFLLFAISGSSAAFFDEKNAGLFQRLLSAPLTRSQLLLSRFLYGVLFGLFQLTTLFFAGHLMYGIDVFGHFGNLVVVCAAAAAACTSFGMLVAAFAPNAQAANGLATFFVMVMSATGGAWFPLSLMPEFMQKIGKLTVVYWSMEGFSQVLWAGNTFIELLPTLGVLLGITAGVMAISIWRINRKPIFE